MITAIRVLGQAVHSRTYLLSTSLSPSPVFFVCRRDERFGIRPASLSARRNRNSTCPLRLRKSSSAQRRNDASNSGSTRNRNDFRSTTTYLRPDETKAIYPCELSFYQSDITLVSSHRLPISCDDFGNAVKNSQFTSIRTCYNEGAGSGNAFFVLVNGDPTYGMLR